LDLLGRHPIPTDAVQSPSLHLQILTLLFRSTTPAEVEDKPEATSTPLPEEPVAPAEELDLEAEAEDSEPEAPAEAEEEEAEVEIEVEEEAATAARSGAPAVSATAEPLDKNRIRFFLHTLGLLSATCEHIWGL
jgi:hypothetical protein